MGRRGVSVGLDRAGVVHAAAALADAHGGEVTLAALAAHLGVRASSLYNHVAGQEGLRRELALLGRRDLATRVVRAAVGRAGADAVREVAHAYRAFAREHPGLYPLTLRSPDPDDAELLAASDDIIMTLVAVLASFGLRDDDAIHAIRGLRALLHGFVTLEAAGGFGMPLAVDESFDRALDALLSGWDPTPGRQA
jgi:AcrR family transcriptional regulator